MCFSSRIRVVFSAIWDLVWRLHPPAFAQLPAIPAAREPVTNIYHGVAVVDDYQWLEDAASSAVRDWTRRQNERTRACSTSWSS